MFPDTALSLAGIGAGTSMGSSPTAGGRTMSKKHMVNVCLFIVVLAALLLPTFLAGRRWPPGGPPWRRCQSDLRQIGMACYVYSADHNEEFPPSQGALFPEYVPDGMLFVCYEASKATEIKQEDLPPGSKDASSVFTQKNTDYVYLPGLKATDHPRCVLMFDKRGNHEDHRNVLFTDRQVQWMTESEFQEALAKTVEYLLTRDGSVFNEQE